MESLAYRQLLNSIDSLFSNDHTRGLVDLPLVSRLIATLCQLIKGPRAAEEPTMDNWAHFSQLSDDLDIRECGEILEKLRSTLYRPMVDPPGEEEVLEEAVIDDARPAEGGQPPEQPEFIGERPAEREPFADGVPVRVPR